MVFFARFITDFGDSAVAGMLSVVLAMVFFATRNRNAAAAMLLAFGGAATLIAVAKIMFYGCHVDDMPATGLRSPSGHAAISAAVYGTFVLIAAARLPAGYRIPAYILTAIFVTAIAVTRVTLGHHSPVEVIFGLSVGAGTCVIVWLTCLRGRPVVVNRVLFVVVALAIIIVSHGIRLPAEAAIDKIAALLAVGCMK